MLKVGLTGGIGSGKTLVAEIFKVLGIPVFDADAAAKNIMENDASLAAAIRSEFGDAAYKGGRLDRKYLAGKVFNDSYELEKLNALVHPAAIQAGLDWAGKQSAPYIIKEAALMFEAGSAFNLQYVIGVYAPTHLRIKRVMDRSSLTRDEVISRMNSQIDDAIKMRLCDFVIVNDEQQMVLPQVLKIHEHFLLQTGNVERA
ncbi:MAG: dephospho-CoA kinase [Chitinophagaceae bacterium]|jgi:dephospho-CoA kinase|nr:dephospho-CoA kinase [Chitinophagaceae bacterium]